MENPVNIAMTQSFTFVVSKTDDDSKRSLNCKYLLREGYTLVLKPEA